jgi:hypothetical protein
MADAVSIIVDATKMIGPKAWADAIGESGFDMRLDPAFEPREDDPVYLPCIYRGWPTGFEYRYVLLDEGERRRARVTLAYRTDPAQRASSAVAGGVLCALAEGSLRDPDTGEEVDPSHAIAWARRHDARYAERATRPPTAGWDFYSTSKAVGINLAIAYAVAVIITTYTAPPNDLVGLMLGPLALVAISALFGLATVAIIRTRTSLERRYRPMRIWLVSTWAAVILSLLDPFVPAPPRERADGPDEIRRGLGR